MHIHPLAYKAAKDAIHATVLGTVAIGTATATAAVIGAPLVTAAVGAATIVVDFVAIRIINEYLIPRLIKDKTMSTVCQFVVIISVPAITGCALGFLCLPAIPLMGVLAICATTITATLATQIAFHILIARSHLRQTNPQHPSQGAAGA